MTTLRASSADIAAHCTGAPALMRANPTERDYLSAGTLAHEWIAHGLCGGPVPQAPRPEDIPWEWIEEVGREHGVPWVLGSPEVALKPMEIGGLTLTGHADHIYCASAGDILTVTDWKAGEGQRWVLPPMAEWMQGLCYAVLAASHYGHTGDVQLLRVRLADREVDSLYLGQEALAAVHAGLEELCASVAAAPETRTPGPHCEHCFGRAHCPEWAAQAEDVKALMVRPSEAVTTAQLARWALARGAVAAAVEAMDELLREAVRGGLRIERDGQVLKLEGLTRESVESTEAVREVVGPEAVEVKVTSSKGLIEKVLQGRGYKPAERRQVLDQLRAAGAIVEKDMPGRLAWRRG